MSTRAAGLGLIAASLFLACDPAYATVIDNQSDGDLAVARRQLISGEASWDQVLVPAGGLITLGTNGVGTTGVLDRVVVLSATCAVLSDELLSDFDLGGQIVVTPDGEVRYETGGNRARGGDAKATALCSDEISAIQTSGN